MPQLYARRYSARWRFCAVALSVCSVLYLSLGFASGARAKTDPHKAEAPQACTISFSDVHGTDYFYDGVRYLYCLSAINGYGDNSFRPYNNTTRGQLSKVVVLGMGWAIVTPGSPHFSDVPANSAFYSYVETAFAHGILSGYSDDTFRPNVTITRGQLAKVVVSALGWPLISPASAGFTDVPASNPFYQYVETAVAHSIISGYGDSTFKPGASATRGQIAKIFYYATGVIQLSSLEQQTISLINSRRAAMGLGALSVNPALMLAARAHSNDIGPAGLCQHNGTNGSSPWDRIDQAGYTGSAMGEVVGCGYSTAQGVVDGWWGSSAHYAILTDPAANDIGCGGWTGPNGGGFQTCDTGSSAR